jgi:multidrug efflux pump
MPFSELIQGIFLFINTPKLLVTFAKLLNFATFTNLFRRRKPPRIGKTQTKIYMNDIDSNKKVVRRFWLTDFSLDNKTTIYLLAIILMIFGAVSYNRMPKELFPEIVIPTVYVQTIYPGNPPIDMENLVTRPLEKELETIKGLKEINSTSSQDVSSIFLEFNTNVDIKKALQEAKDAIDNAKSELPDDLPADPMAMDIDFSEFPIVFINLSGDYSLEELKKYAEYLEDQIEQYPEISKVEIKGLNDREIQVDIDPYKMESMQISFNDIESAIGFENISMASGQIRQGNTRMTISVLGEFKSVEEIKNIIVKQEFGKVVHLMDIADVKDGFAEPNSFSRLNKQPVVALNVIKKGGENLLNATDKIFKLLDDSKANRSLPKDLKVTITNDQSDIVRRQLHELENSMILGIILVVLVLYFFLGGRNSMFVALAIPLSMFISFFIFSMMDYKLNMMMIFSLILALGMLVDDAIVTVENTFRHVEKGYTREESSRIAVGEVAIPVITSTLTTLAAFFPLLFWKSMIGEFMQYLPIVLIITLASSLFVALSITPVLTASFMKAGDPFSAPKRKRSLIIVGIMLVFATIFYVSGNNKLGSLLVIFAFLGIANLLFLNRAGRYFYNHFLNWLDNKYQTILKYALKKRHPYYFLLGAIGLLFFTIFLMVVRQPKVVFFPSADPQYINILATLPVGTDIHATDTLMMKVEKDVFEILEPYKSVVKSVQTTVGNGARGENDFMDASETPNKGLITVTFVDYELRGDVSSWDVMKKFTDNLINRYPGVLMSVEKQNEGPPTGKAINLEIIGEDFDKLVSLSDSIEMAIAQSGIQGIEGLKLDINLGKPELLVHIDREKARQFGLSTGQIAMTLRTALFGRDLSDYKVGEDEFPIQLRLKKEYRNSMASLMNMKITFRDMLTGKIKQIPISAVADITYTTTFESVKRKDLKRVVTLYSNVLKGYNGTEINTELKTLLSNYPMPVGYEYKFTGEQEEQQDAMAFLVTALLGALALILLITVTQFNSIVKPLIIMVSVLLSTIGVFGGLATFKMDFVIIMTGIGIISLAGIVVKNAIVLIDYVDLTKLRKRFELGLDKKATLPIDLEVECVIQAGKTRLRPVLLTALTAILGLIPLAAGLNINFNTFLESFQPHIYFGGDNVAFWGPISWTIIFGLTFSTLLTLIIVPVIYHILYRGKIRISKILRRQG